MDNGYSLSKLLQTREENEMKDVQLELDNVWSYMVQQWDGKRTYFDEYWRKDGLHPKVLHTLKNQGWTWEIVPLSACVPGGRRYWFTPTVSEMVPIVPKQPLKDAWVKVMNELKSKNL